MEKVGQIAQYTFITLVTKFGLKIFFLFTKWKLVVTYNAICSDFGFSFRFTPAGLFFLDICISPSKKMQKKFHNSVKI